MLFIASHIPTRLLRNSKPDEDYVRFEVLAMAAMKIIDL
jgi:hypothetical protein